MVENLARKLKTMDYRPWTMDSSPAREKSVF